MRDAADRLSVLIIEQNLRKLIRSGERQNGEE
jgi:hypothetical protein